LAGKRRQLQALMAKTEEADFWNDIESAQKHMQLISQVRQTIEPWEELRARWEDLQVLAELAVEEGDDSVEQEIRQGVQEIRRQLAALELKTFLAGKHDRATAVLTITAGAGGTESCDWAEMLLRMYQLWADRHGYDFQVVSFVEGEGAGFRNVTARVVGEFAYGYLKAEAGVHRLVRISPFDASKRRHTSFASVDVIPEIDDDVEVVISPEDLRIDTFRSSGAGGQHVNKTDSAVRITHLPTGIVVQCQNERSQHANRRTAMRVLRARLAQLERQKQNQEIENLRGNRGKIDFGSQIRSYVMMPYKMVKDHRTGVETSDVDGVLNGDIDGFIQAYLQTMAGQGR